jgi:hypothetical protein
MEIELTDEECSYILECIERDVEAADEVEQKYYQERLFETPEEFLDVLDSHQDRTELMLELRLKLGGMTDGSKQPDGEKRLQHGHGPRDPDAV